EFLDFDISLGGLTEFAEQILDVLRVRFKYHRHPALTARAVKANLHRRIELREDGPGARRKRVGVFRGEVDALLGTTADDVEGDQHDEHRHHADRRIEI